MERKNPKFYCLLLVLIFVGLSQAFAQQVFKTTKPSVIGYLEYLPQGYSGNSNKYPVVIHLHGVGEKGPASTDPNVLDDGIPKLIKLGPPKYVNNGTQFPFILISPQLKSSYGSWTSGYVKEVIDHVKTYLRIDESRIYLTGLSLGGGGTWVTAQDFPRLFAAIAPICGGYNSPSKAANIALENLPVWAFHGDADTVVPISRSQSMVNAINACSPVPTPKAKLTVYPGVKHNAWDFAYKPDHSVHNPNVYDWLLSYTNKRNGSNTRPVANAGTDKSVSANKVSITASGSDANGSITGYSWAQISGPSNATLANASGATVTASNLVSGTYMFRVRVTDNGGDTDTDYVKVAVQSSTTSPAPTTNVAPVANAGANKAITLPTSSVYLYGNGTDSDGTIASYKWTKVSGPAAALSGATTKTLKAYALLSGTYVFRLTVTDNDGATKSDDVSVVVKTATTTTNVAPIANAGPNKFITLPTRSVYLYGSGSDSDGTVASYQWTKVSGPAASLAYAGTRTLKAYSLVQGTYTFRLTVTDNKGAKKSDDVTVTVNPIVS